MNPTVFQGYQTGQLLDGDRAALQQTLPHRLRAGQEVPGQPDQTTHSLQVLPCHFGPGPRCATIVLPAVLESDSSFTFDIYKWQLNILIFKRIQLGSILPDS